MKITNLLWHCVICSMIVLEIRKLAYLAIDRESVSWIISSHTPKCETTVSTRLHLKSISFWIIFNANIKLITVVPLTLIFKYQLILFFFSYFFFLFFLSSLRQQFIFLLSSRLLFLLSSIFSAIFFCFLCKQWKRYAVDDKKK